MLSPSLSFNSPFPFIVIYFLSYFIFTTYALPAMLPRQSLKLDLDLNVSTVSFFVTYGRMRRCFLDLIFFLRCYL